MENLLTVLQCDAGKRVAIKVGNKIYADDSYVQNHACLAERLGFPENLTLGWIDNAGNFFCQ